MQAKICGSRMAKETLVCSNPVVWLILKSFSGLTPARNIDYHAVYHLFIVLSHYMLTLKMSTVESVLCTPCWEYVEWYSISYQRLQCCELLYRRIFFIVLLCLAILIIYMYTCTLDGHWCYHLFSVKCMGLLLQQGINFFFKSNYWNSKSYLGLLHLPFISC